MASALFDKHHPMLRFTVTVATSLALVAVAVGLAIHGAIAKGQQTFADSPLYTTDVSIGNKLKGTAEGVWASKDGRKAFLLFQLDDDTLAKLPTDAKSYKAYVYATDASGSVDTMKVKPSGSVYVFGSTGAIGVYLVAGEPFQPQLLNVLFLTTTMSGDKVSWTVTMNPAASKVGHASALDADSLDVAALWRQCGLSSAEDELRSALADDGTEAYTQAKTLSEYTDRLDSLGVSTFGMRPSELDGMSFTTDDDGTVHADLGPAVPGGLDIDWQSTKLTDGGSYLKLAYEATDTDSYAGVLAKLAEGYTKTDTEVPTDLTQWHMTDGRTVSDAVTSMTSNTAKDVRDSITAWTDAANALVEAKTKYQTTDTLALLALENDASDMSKSTSSADVTVIGSRQELEATNG